MALESNKTESRLYCVQDILEKGVYLQNGEILPIIEVVIPRIQRAYAQGRIEEHNVRKNILSSVFDILVDNKCEDFGFLYGAAPDGRLTLLDGQQRFTTLYLVNWYVLHRECGNKPLPEYLRHFVYETRTTSTDFLYNITHSDKDYIINGEIPPSEIIKSKIWFTEEFRCDSTVMSILTMLDAIHEKYNELEGAPSFSTQLHKLRFYVLLLEQFGMSEDLYIKLNARGLRLCPFENFKADIVGAVKKYCANEERPMGDRMVPFDIYFSSKIDTDWVDLFWERNEDMEESDRKYNARFLRVFSRYFAFKAFLINGVNEDNSELIDFLIDDAEDRQSNEYLGFEFYNRVLSNYGSTLFTDMCKVMDFFKEHYNRCLKQMLLNPWDESDWHFYNRDKKKQFTYSNRVAWMAMLLFIEKMSYDCSADIWEKQLKIWMRVVWKVIVYYAPVRTIDKKDVAERYIRIFKSIIECLDLNDIYLSLASLGDDQVRDREWEEVRLQSQMIIRGRQENNREYESIIESIESYGNFKGLGAFFLTGEESSSEAKQKFKLLKKVYTGNGISDDFRGQEHLMMRAMLASLKKWGDMQHYHISESDGLDMRAKFAVCDTVRDMIKELVKAPDQHEYLRQVIKAGTPTSNDVVFYKVYHRLKDNPELIDWILRQNNGKYLMEIKNASYAYKVHLNMTDIWVDLDTDRSEMLQCLSDPSHSNPFSIIGEVFTDTIPRFVKSWNTSATRTIIDHSGVKWKVKVQFNGGNQYRKVCIILHCNEYKERVSLLKSLPQMQSYAPNCSPLDDGGLYVKEYDYMDIINPQDFVEKIKRDCNTLEQLIGDIN